MSELFLKNDSIVEIDPHDGNFTSVILSIDACDMCANLSVIFVATPLFLRTIHSYFTLNLLDIAEEWRIVCDKEVSTMLSEFSITMDGGFELGDADAFATVARRSTTRFAVRPLRFQKEW